MIKKLIFLLVSILPIKGIQAQEGSMYLLDSMVIPITNLPRANFLFGSDDKQGIVWNTHGLYAYKGSSLLSLYPPKHYNRADIHYVSRQGNCLYLFDYYHDHLAVIDTSTFEIKTYPLQRALGDKEYDVSRLYCLDGLKVLNNRAFLFSNHWIGDSVNFYGKSSSYYRHGNLGIYRIDDDSLRLQKVIGKRGVNYFKYHTLSYLNAWSLSYDSLHKKMYYSEQGNADILIIDMSDTFYRIDTIPIKNTFKKYPLSSKIEDWSNQRKQMGYRLSVPRYEQIYIDEITQKIARVYSSPSKVVFDKDSLENDLKICGADPYITTMINASNATTHYYVQIIADKKLKKVLPVPSGRYLYGFKEDILYLRNNAYPYVIYRYTYE